MANLDIMAAQGILDGGVVTKAIPTVTLIPVWVTAWSTIASRSAVAEVMGAAKATQGTESAMLKYWYRHRH